MKLYQLKPNLTINLTQTLTLEDLRPGPATRITMVDGSNYVVDRDLKDLSIRFIRAERGQQ